MQSIETNPDLETVVADQAKAISDLTRRLEAEGEDHRRTRTAKEAAEKRVAELREFMQSIGINPEAVERGLWVANAAALLDVTVDEAGADLRLGDVTPDARALILTAARSIVPPPSI